MSGDIECVCLPMEFAPCSACARDRASCDQCFWVKETRRQAKMEVEAEAEMDRAEVDDSRVEAVVRRVLVEWMDEQRQTQDAHREAVAKVVADIEARHAPARPPDIPAKEPPSDDRVRRFWEIVDDAYLKSHGPEDMPNGPVARSNWDKLVHKYGRLQEAYAELFRQTQRLKHVEAAARAYIESGDASEVMVTGGVLTASWDEMMKQYMDSPNRYRKLKTALEGK